MPFEGFFKKKSIQEIRGCESSSVLIDYSLVNQKRLFSSQEWIDPEKIQWAVLGISDPYEIPVSVYKFDGDHYLVVEGHHRVARALVNCNCIEGNILGTLQNVKQFKTYGFNKIIQQFKLATKSFS
jgi:hypothetical protein